MRIKSFKNFKKINENYTELSFEEKLEQNDDVIDNTKSILQRALETMSNKLANVKTEEDFNQTLLNNIVVYDTDIADFNLDDQIDLCIYNEVQGGEKCPETTWDELGGIIYNTAISGLAAVINNIIEKQFLPEFNSFMTKNKLSYTNVSYQSGYDNYSPENIKTIKNGEIYQFRELDGEYNIDEYVFNHDDFNISIYIKKEI